MPEKLKRQLTLIRPSGGMIELINFESDHELLEYLLMGMYPGTFDVFVEVTVPRLKEEQDKRRKKQK